MTIAQARGATTNKDYSWIEYETMFACCCVGAGNTADISVPKTVENILHLVNKFPQTGYSREQLVETLESLVKQGLLEKVEDCYKRPPYVCSRSIRGLIPGQPDRRIMTIIRLYGRQDVDVPGSEECTLLWSFMIMPSLCKDYNQKVNEVLQEDFDSDLKQAHGSLEKLKKLVKAYKEIDVVVQTAMGLTGTFGIGAA